MAAALVGGAFLSAFLQVLFDRIASRDFLKLFQKRKVDHELLKKLKTNLLTVGAVLDDAENKETRNQAVKEWLEELHETVYEADDLLDQINTESLRVKVETEYQSSSSTDQVSSTVFTTYNSDHFLEWIMPEIEKIVVRLDGFIQQIVPLGLQNVESKIKSYRTPSTSLVDETTVYGRDVDKDKIIQMLLSEDANVDNNFSVVSIVGLGGIGKTTLAQSVYNDEKVKNHFPTTKAWVCVSEDYDANRITKELLEELNISFSDSSESLNSLQVKLQRGLTDKKFLLVLDDVWNRQYCDWEKLKILFQGGSNGSKIIVTTRDERIARMMGQKRSIHRLDIISKEDSWSLFEKHAFEDGDNENRRELEEIGKKIVSKCEGLPLAVKTIAGLLRSTRMVEEWKDILENDVWNQTRNPDDILPALKLSYTHLPSYLKRCFAYCAVFHKDFQFAKDQIIMLWHANGLLEHLKDDKRILKDIGDEYLGELRMRSLLEEATNNHFCMHDLINDLAKSVFGKFCVRLEDHDLGHGTVARVRNFTYYASDYDAFDKFKLLREIENLRTFLPLKNYFNYRNISNKFLHDMLPRFKSLRFLSLAQYNINKLPDSFSDLKQLRLLDLSSTNIIKLPEWVCTWYNLQTLVLTNCKKLEELPIHLAKLINLCYLDIRGTRLNKMPIQMCRLKNLQVLTNFVVGKDGGSGIQELGQFQKLCSKQLLIFGLENVYCGRDASMANLKGMKHLEHLTLNWNGDAENSQVARDVFDELQPHSSIKHLKINGYCGTRLPDWLGNPLFCHMKSLSLYNCQYCFGLPPVGQLPSLESLEIVGMSKILALSLEIYGDNCEIKPFQCLKRLKIQNMEELERWEIPECETFCNLEELSIMNCPRLVRKLPTNLSSLRTLVISECDELELPNGQLSIFQGDIQQLLSLGELKVSALQNLKKLYPGPDSLPSLKVLKIKDCKSLLPLRIAGLPATLKTLEYDGCGEFLLLEGESSHGGTVVDSLTLRNLDSLNLVSLGLFPMLKSVDILGCKSIEMLSFGIQGSSLSLTSSLKHLHIQGCHDLMCFPEGGLSVPSLGSLWLDNCKKLKSLLSMHMGLSRD